MKGKAIGKILVQSFVVVLAVAYLWYDKLVIWNIDRIFLGNIILVAMALWVGGKLSDVIFK